MLPSEFKDMQEKCTIDIKACKEKGWEEIKPTLNMMIRKRGMPKTVATSLIEIVYEWTLEEEFLKNKEQAIDVLEYLGELTEGKIFFEVIRARVLTRLADYKEEEGDLNGAKLLLQDIQVEAFTTMDIREKTEFIIKQMRLILASKDYVRVQIASRKLSKKTLDLPELEDFKVHYYNYLISYHIHEKNFLDASKCYEELMTTECIKSDIAQFSLYASCHAIMAVLADNHEKSSEIQKAFLKNESIKTSADLRLKTVLALCTSLLSADITQWPLDNSESELLWSSPIFQEEVFDDSEFRRSLFNRRILEKNLRLIATTHRKISLKELAELVYNNVDEVETVLVDLIGHDIIHAKIDRSAMTASFQDPKSANDLAALDCAGASLAEALAMIGGVVHQIDREIMLHEQWKQEQVKM